MFGRGSPTAGRWVILALPVLIVGLTGCQTQEPPHVLSSLPGPIIMSREKPALPPPPPPAPPPLKTIAHRTIVVDAGHGGKDPGAMPKYRGQMREKDINLDIARKVGSQLSSRGARVVMTRTSDTFLELDDRARVADRYRCDLLLSVHVDASPKRWISGTGIFIHNQASYQTMRIAQCMASSFRRNGISCRGINRRNFAVLREHNSPGILIETGYLTNAAESQRLNDSAYRNKLAAAIAEGVADHFAR